MTTGKCCRLPRPWGGTTEVRRHSVLRSAGPGAVLTPRTQRQTVSLGSLNWIFWYNLFPVLKKHISSTLVHCRLGNCLFSIILTSHKLIVLDFLFKSPSSFFFLINQDDYTIVLLSFSFPVPCNFSGCGVIFLIQTGVFWRQAPLDTSLCLSQPPVLFREKDSTGGGGGERQTQAVVLSG